MISYAYQTRFYVVGGTLSLDAPCYVKRQSDTDLYNALSDGNFCYVLTSRQTGKSSLMVRTAVRLRQEGVAVAVLDLSAFGQSLSVEQWYDSLLARLGQQLDLEDKLEKFWLENARLEPLQRWMRAVREVVLPSSTGQVVIFIDEIDTVRSLPFSTDDFFAAIRGFYNRRSLEADLHRLTYCFLGVAMPSDLIEDIRLTPFEMGRRIELTDFTEAEAATLAKGLGRKGEFASKLLHRVLYWTGGHPYLSQRLCQAVADHPEVITTEDVDDLCHELFLSFRARERDDNILFVRQRLLRDQTQAIDLLNLYAKVHSDERVPADETNPLISILLLSGITRVVDGSLRVRNRIYQTVFDQEWVKFNAPSVHNHPLPVYRKRSGALWQAK
jgi:AAA-like domain